MQSSQLYLNPLPGSWVWLAGLGFTSVLLDLGAPGFPGLGAPWRSTWGWKAGTTGDRQGLLPLAYGARHTVLYARMVFGSLAILVLAALWLVERGLDLKLL